MYRPWICLTCSTNQNKCAHFDSRPTMAPSKHAAKKYFIIVKAYASVTERGQMRTTELHSAMEQTYHAYVDESDETESDKNELHLNGMRQRWTGRGLYNKSKELKRTFTNVYLPAFNKVKPPDGQLPARCRARSNASSTPQKARSASHPNTMSSRWGSRLHGGKRSKLISSPGETVLPSSRRLFPSCKILERTVPTSAARSLPS